MGWQFWSSYCAGVSHGLVLVQVLLCLIGPGLGSGVCCMNQMWPRCHWLVLTGGWIRVVKSRSTRTKEKEEVVPIWWMWAKDGSERGPCLCQMWATFGSDIIAIEVINLLVLVSSLIPIKVLTSRNWPIRSPLFPLLIRTG